MAFILKVSETAQSVVVNPQTIAAQGAERSQFHDYRPIRHAATA
jgi:hypothetical protein